MLVKTKGIVLQHLKYGDSSIISHIFTKEYGKKSFIIKGARSKKAKIKSNLFQILNILNLEFHHKETRELRTIRDVNRAKIFNSFPYDVTKSTQAMFIAEVLENCIAEDDPDSLLFEYLENALEYFDLIEDDHANFHLAFLMKLTLYLGILPSLDKNDKASLQTNSGSIPSGIRQMSRKNPEVIHKLYTYNFDEGLAISLSREKRNSILHDIINFYTLNGYYLSRLKSLPVLKELFL